MMSYPLASKFQTKYRWISQTIYMNKNGPVIIIEDDGDDQDFLTEVFQNLNYPNKIIFFSDPQKLLIS